MLIFSKQFSCAVGSQTRFQVSQGLSQERCYHISAEIRCTRRSKFDVELLKCFKTFSFNQFSRYCVQSFPLEKTCPGHLIELSIEVLTCITKSSPSSKDNTTFQLG